MVLRPSTATPWPWWLTSWPAMSAWAKPPLPSLALVAVGLVPVILFSRTLRSPPLIRLCLPTNHVVGRLPCYSTVCRFLSGDLMECKTV